VPPRPTLSSHLHRSSCWYCISAHSAQHG